MSSDVKELIHKYVPDSQMSRFGKIFTDTTEFMNIDYSDVIKLGNEHFLVLKNEQERRFGLVDPKYWVKRGKHLESGQPQILKLAFYETFPMHIGPFEIKCYRSPRKESKS